MTLAGVVTATALQATEKGGGFAALLLAALAWAVVSATAGRLLRDDAPRVQRTSSAAPLGALIAVLAFHRLDDPRGVADAASTLVLAASALLLMRRPLARAISAGRTVCLPSSPALIAARCVMAPMMVSLAWGVVTCRAAGMAPATMLASHLAAMFVPALLLQRWSSPPRAQAALTAAVALTMGAGACLLVAAEPMPWLASLLQGVAWSLAGLVRPVPLESRDARAPLVVPLAGALLVALLGAAVARYGSAALNAVQIALGLASGCSWLVSSAHAPTPFTAPVRTRRQPSR